LDSRSEEGCCRNIRTTSDSLCVGIPCGIIASFHRVVGAFAQECGNEGSCRRSADRTVALIRAEVKKGPYLALLSVPRRSLQRECALKREDRYGLIANSCV
jgi:hypothetical protein